MKDKAACNMGTEATVDPPDEVGNGTSEEKEKNRTPQMPCWLVAVSAYPRTRACQKSSKGMMEKKDNVHAVIRLE